MPSYYMHTAGGLKLFHSAFLNLPRYHLFISRTFLLVLFPFAGQDILHSYRRRMSADPARWEFACATDWLNQASESCTAEPLIDGIVATSKSVAV